jgi:hypothetical protein
VQLFCSPEWITYRTSLSSLDGHTPEESIPNEHRAQAHSKEHTTSCSSGNRDHSHVWYGSDFDQKRRKEKTTLLDLLKRMSFEKTGKMNNLQSPKEASVKGVQQEKREFW